MLRRLKSDLEDWEIEIVDAMENNLHGNQYVLDYIADGGLVIDDDVGDITREERRKADWKVKEAKAALARLEFNLANDNDPPMDEELADLIAGEW